MTTKLLLSPDYVAFVNDLKARIQSARVSAARAVNRDLILLYWDIGRGIVERQKTLGWASRWSSYWRVICKPRFLRCAVSRREIFGM